MRIKKELFAKYGMDVKLIQLIETAENRKSDDEWLYRSWMGEDLGIGSGFNRQVSMSGISTILS